MVASRGTTLETGDRPVAGCDGRISVRDVKVAGENVKVAGCDRGVSVRLPRVSVRDVDVAGRDLHLAGRDAEVSAGELPISVRGTHLAGADGFLSHRPSGTYEQSGGRGVQKGLSSAMGVEETDRGRVLETELLSTAGQGGQLMSRNNQGSNPGSVEARINALIKGLQGVPATENFDVEGTGTGPVSLTSELVGRAGPYSTANQAHQAATNAIRARDVAEPETLRRLESIEAAIRNHYGDKSPKLKDFGLTPRKTPRTLTPEEQQHKVAALRATRAKDGDGAKSSVNPPATSEGGAKAT